MNLTQDGSSVGKSGVQEVVIDCEPEDGCKEIHMSRMGLTVGVLCVIGLACGGVAPISSPQPSPADALPSSDQPNTKRQGHKGIALADGKILFFGGFSDDTAAELYDPSSGRWLTLDSSRGRSRTSAVTLLDGRVLLINGYGQQDADPYDDTWRPKPYAEVFDPKDLRFTRVSPPSTASAHEQAVQLKDGRVLLWGCSETGTAHVEVYEATKDAWSVQAGPPDCSSSSRMVSVEEGAMLTAGFQGPNYLFDAATNAWKTTAPSPLTRQAEALRLPDNRVLVMGRPYASEKGPHAAVYDVVTDQWVPTGPLSRVFKDSINSTFALVNQQGRVLLLGGSLERPPRCTATVESLDLTSLTWSSVRPLSQARSTHSANVLNDGTLLIYGGYGTSPDSGECRVLRGDYEIYSP